MRVFTQFDEELRVLWTKAFAANTDQWPFLTFAWHEAWHRQLAPQDRLMVISDDLQHMILPLVIQTKTAHFSGGEEIADYLDMIGDNEKKKTCWQASLATLSSNGVTHLSLRNIPDHSQSLDFFRNLDGAQVEEEDSTPILRLPDSFEAYVSSLDRKKRHELRRKLRKFDEQNQKTEFTTLAKPDMELLLRLMRQNPEKNVFLTPGMEKFFRDLPTIVSSHLMQFVLYQGDNPIATALGFTSGKSLLLYNSGYNPSIEGAGWYLKSKLIAWSLDHSFSEINFLQGKERYKYDLGASDAFVYRVTLAL